LFGKVPNVIFNPLTSTRDEQFENAELKQSAPISDTFIVNADVIAVAPVKVDWKVFSLSVVNGIVMSLADIRVVQPLKIDEKAEV
jgi:hypothetical protein